MEQVKHRKNSNSKAFSKIAGLAMVMIMLFVAIPQDINAKSFDAEAVADSSQVYEVVDQMPEIKGGVAKIYEYIEYPKRASSTGVEGRVFIKFIVNEQGEVENPEILKDIGAGCGEAALKGVKKLEFTPGVHKGEKVKVYYTLPVTFKLK